MDYQFYLLALLIMTAIFVCGYKIGHMRGWRHGYNDYGTVLEQKSRFRTKPDNDGDWQYQGREKGVRQ